MASIEYKILKNKQKVYYVVYRLCGEQKWHKAGKNKAVAEQVKNEIEKQLILGTLGLFEYKPLPFSHFVDNNFLPAKLCEKELRPSTIRIYKNSCHHLKNYFQNKMLNVISTEDILKYRNIRLKAINDRAVSNGIKVTDTTGNRGVNIELQTLKQILDYAFITKHIKDNPYIPKLIKKLPEFANTRYLSEAEENLLLANASVWARCIIHTVLMSGMRHSELSNLKFSDIDYANRLITVRAEVSKNKKEDHIYMNETLTSILLFLEKNWIHPKTDKILIRQPYQKEFVFCNKTGERILSFKKALETAVKKAGLENVSMHTLRKTAGSRLVQKGVSLKTVSGILRHSDTKVTEKHYAFLNDKTKLDAVNLLDNGSPVRYMLDEPANNNNLQLLTT